MLCLEGREGDGQIVAQPEPGETAEVPPCGGAD
jgi:hypothetical protein